MAFEGSEHPAGAGVCLWKPGMLGSPEPGSAAPFSSAVPYIEQKPLSPSDEQSVSDTGNLQAFMSLQGQERQQSEKCSRSHVVSSSPKHQKTGNLSSLFINPALSAPYTHRITGQ